MMKNNLLYIIVQLINMKRNLILKLYIQNYRF